MTSRRTAIKLRTRPNPQLIPAAVAAAGAALLLAQWIGGRPLWLDEQMIAINIRDRSFTALGGALSLGQTAPYGWLVLQRLVLLVFGNGELALRIVPVAFGIATLAAALWIGRRYFGPLGATVLALLCATGQWLTLYNLELKPYAGDAFFALLLPALAARTAEEPRRAIVFWTVAAAGAWFANGAYLVTPAAAAALALASWQRGGWRTAWRVMAPASIWLASFAAVYAITIRHAIGSSYLQGTWAFALPPAGASLWASIRWVAGQIGPLAVKPLGSSIGMIVWVAAAAGFLLAPSDRRVLAAASALVVLSAFALAALRLVPLYERVSIWMVPAVYVGIAMLADSASRRSRAVAIGAAVVSAVLVAEIAARGALDVPKRSPDSNRSLDDRGAIRWLMSRREPGSVWLTTHYGLPAIWWYAPEARTADPTYELSFSSDRAGCARDALTVALGGHPRALVYLGFRFDDTPPGFDDLVVDRLSELGAVVAFRRFDVNGIALAIDLRQSASFPTTLSALDATTSDQPIRPDGCLSIRKADSY